MSIFAIKQSYIVNSILFISFLILISLGLIGGCSDNGGGQNDTQALTENDFAENSDLRSDLKGVVVTFLESPMSEEAENDTGEVGIDLIPVTYQQTTEQTFCWVDEDIEAMHFMELRDSQGSLVLTVQANGDCVIEVIEAGEYVVSIYHDEKIGDPLPIFLMPSSQASEQTRETDGFIDRVNVAAANLIKAIQKTVTKDAKAQTVTENTNTLLYTNSCVECNLARARLDGVRLIRANLLGANLSGARLRGANLSGADLRGSVDLSGAILEFANLSGARLIGANMRGAELRLADLRGANLSGVNFSGATWCDGSCVCAQGSFGRCNGCASVDICTGP